MSIVSESRKKSDEISIRSDKSNKKAKLPKAFLSAMEENLYNKVPNRGPDVVEVPGNVSETEMIVSTKDSFKPNRFFKKI